MSILLQDNCFAQTAGGIVKRPSNKTNLQSSRFHSNSDLNSNYGIKRVVDGITLGKTTKQEVISMLKRKGLSYSFQDISGVPIIYVNEYNSSFGGNLWQTVSYYLYKSIVFQIDYSKSVISGTDTNSIDFEFSNIKNKLIQKYGNYQVDRKSFPNFRTSYFRDKMTEIKISTGNYQGYYHLSLSYIDLGLLDEVYNQADDDL